MRAGLSQRCAWMHDPTTMTSNGVGSRSFVRGRRVISPMRGEVLVRRAERRSATDWVDP